MSFQMENSGIWWKGCKNSSGYSLKDLMIGSEGTLGFITKATLKLLPLPKKAISLLIPFKTLKEAIDTVPLIIKSKAIPTAIEFMQREVIIDAEEYLGKNSQILNPMRIFCSSLMAIQQKRSKQTMTKLQNYA